MDRELDLGLGRRGIVYPLSWYSFCSDWLIIAFNVNIDPWKG
jgi:hypothetical protein